MNYEKEIERLLLSARNRREKGAIQYGPENFLNKDLIQETEDELVDAINYILFLAVKLGRMKQLDENMIQEVLPPDMWRA